MTRREAVRGVAVLAMVGGLAGLLIAGPVDAAISKGTVKKIAKKQAVKVFNSKIEQAIAGLERKVHWAVIAPNASILAQSGGMDVEGASGAGVYWINFPTTVTDKAAVATVRADTAATGEIRTIPCGGPPLGVTCAVGPNNPSELFVSTHDSTGATAARSFYVAVIP